MRAAKVKDHKPPMRRCALTYNGGMECPNDATIERTLAADERGMPRAPRWTPGERLLRRLLCGECSKEVQGMVPEAYGPAPESLENGWHPSFEEVP